ncbi:ATPase WRNIP1-like [Melitaea cinxia]|uniref:ATPase WRNIP1-like n=1 Tax=Melitaea cinxia TaxID=113334 RepID=UPI001E26F286|nr:ATPase WRNIP1-like [Melitaea cinxia]
MATATENDELVICPVCDRYYEKQNIEKHVDKCIFLNTLPEKSPKRGGSHLEENTQQKKIKLLPGVLSSTSQPKTSATQAKLSQTHTLTSKVTSPEQTKSSNDTKHIPLAEAMRPNVLDDIVGQTESFGVGSMIHSMLMKKIIPNMILWGPPGCGKTSIANVIAKICATESDLRFVKLSATMSGINDVKEAVKVAKNEACFKRRTVLFMDEIHRFNKLQQDTFLQHVENGTITLIGATTENPSFSLNNALLSRCKVIVLSKLSVDEVWQILERAVLRNNLAVVVDNIDDKLNDEDIGDKWVIERKSMRWLAEICDGDARIALGALELVLNAGPTGTTTSNRKLISLEDLKRGIKRSHILYDRHGEEHYNVVSAIHKSIRAGDDNAALYWTTRALHGGEDPLFLARRLVRAAAEDIGLGDPSALVEAVACLQGCQHIGMPECDVLLAQCAVRLARADKSTEVYRAMKRVQATLKEHKGPLPPVPLPLRNAPTKLMKDLGYGKGYNMRHRDSSGICYMPEGTEHVNFFNEDG